jgi:RNA polymerase sigma factor (sigma-70 family)
VTKEEIVSYATDCAQVFCRERKIDEQEHEDYLQEAVVIALSRSLGKTVNKHFISESVKKELLKLWRRETNEGFGSHNVSSPDHVSLSETVNGSFDEDGEPLTYGDTLVYEEPPEGYGDPADELETTHDMARMLRAVKSLSSEDQKFVEVALLSGRTQAAAATILGVSSSAVAQRTKTIVKRLQTILM